MADYKKVYQGHWAESAEREKFGRRIVESYGYTLEKQGLGCESTEYIPYGKQDKTHEKGMPDYKIKGTNKMVEITGTAAPVSPVSDLWIRKDKVEYAKNHPEYEIIAIHILDHFHLARWIYMKDCANYPLKTKSINSVTTDFHIIPAYSKEVKEIKERKNLTSHKKSL